MFSTPFYIIHRRQVDYLLANRESGVRSHKHGTNYVRFNYPPKDPGVLPTGEILIEIEFILYNTYGKDISKRLFKKDFDLYPTLDTIISHVDEGETPEFFYYLFNDGSIDLYVGFDDMDPNTIESEMNEYATLLDDGNFSYNRLREFIHIPNVNNVIVHLIGASYDNYNLPKELQELDMALLINKYPHHVFDFIKYELSLYPQYMRVAKNDASEYRNLYDLGLLYLDHFKGKSHQSEQLFFKEIYFELANVLISNPGGLTDDEQLLVLDYLIKADDFPGATSLRTRLFWGWMGKLGQESFDINLDVKTLFNLMKLIRKK